MDVPSLHCQMLSSLTLDLINAMAIMHIALHLVKSPASVFLLSCPLTPLCLTWGRGGVASRIAGSCALKCELVPQAISLGLPYSRLSRVNSMYSVVWVTYFVCQAMTVVVMRRRILGT